MLLRFITKKRDCTAAVPLFEALVLPLIPNKQHRSPRQYVRTRTHVFTSVYGENIHIPRTSKCCNVLESVKFTRFRIAKHKALMTPLLCLQLPHPKDIIPRRGLITGAKVVKYFEIYKKRVILSDFFRIFLAYVKIKQYFRTSALAIILCLR